MAAPSPLNITVHVPDTIRGAFQGRRKVELGVPSNADVGELLEALARLYPKLVALWASERKDSWQGIRILLAERASLDLARRGSGLHDGDLVYLASPAIRPPRPPSR
jgi:hypothetical protein